MDWQWALTAILIPTSIALWRWGESLLTRRIQSRIKREEDKAAAQLALEEKKAQAAIEAATAQMALAKQEAEATLASRRDEQEARQRREDLELATVLGNQSFKDEQITAMAAEAQTEAQAAGKFIRDQYARMTEQMVTQAELEEVCKRLTEMERRIVSIHTYLLSIVQELRDDRDRYRRQAEDKDFEIISGLQEEIAILKAKNQRREAGEG